MRNIFKILFVYYDGNSENGAGDENIIILKRCAVWRSLLKQCEPTKISGPVVSTAHSNNGPWSCGLHLRLENRGGRVDTGGLMLKHWVSEKHVVH